MSRRPGAFLRRSLVVAVLVSACACGRTREGALAAEGPRPPTIRVLLGAPHDSAAVVASGEWTATAVSGSSFAETGRDLSAGLVPSAAGIVFRGTASGASVLRISAPAGFTVADEAGKRLSYRGDLLVRVEAGRLVLVNETDMETYVAGVIVNEIGPLAVPASFRAQAVAARTWAYVQWKEKPEATWHVTDSDKSQVYRGVSLPTPSPVTVADLDRFVSETRGVVLTWHSEPFPAYYASTCGGHTTDAETSDLPHSGFLEPLSGVPCRYCESSKYFNWTETVPESRLLEGLKDRGVAAPIAAVEITKTGRGGWVAEVTLTHGAKGSKKVVPGPVFRRAAGLRSMHWEAIEPVAGGWTIRGKGWGHGVGMCQVGCQEMGRRGLSDGDILRYYYPGAETTRFW